MVNGKPLFPGVSEEDQLNRIFKLLGTPNIETWPQLSELPSYNPEFSKYDSQPLQNFIPNLGDLGIDLLKCMLKLNPQERITAKDALLHPYFDDIPEELKVNSRF